MARALIMNNEVHARIKEVVHYAETHVLSMDDMLDIINKQRDPPGDDPNHVVHIPIGFRVVFSLEHQNVGVCKHLSISVDTPGKLPSPVIVEGLIEEFGIWTPMEDCVLGVEEIGPGRQAVTVIEPPPK